MAVLSPENQALSNQPSALSQNQNLAADPIDHTHIVRLIPNPRRSAFIRGKFLPFLYPSPSRLRAAFSVSANKSVERTPPNPNPFDKEQHREPSEQRRDHRRHPAVRRPPGT